MSTKAKSLKAKAKQTEAADTLAVRRLRKTAKERGFAVQLDKSRKGSDGYYAGSSTIRVVTIPKAKKEYPSWVLSASFRGPGVEDRPLSLENAAYALQNALWRPPAAG